MSLINNKNFIVEDFNSKVFKAIAREQGIKGWARMTKAKLVEALQPIEIVMDNLRVTKLKSIAKVRGMKGIKQCVKLN